jgi:kexin
VLAYSARKNDPTDADWTLNGAGLHVNHKYGFGAADAAAAVTLAKSFPAGAPVVDFSPPASNPGLAIPDNDATGVSDAVTVSSSGIAKVDFVEVEVTVTHPRSGDLDLVLSHSGGVASVFMAPHACDQNPSTHKEICGDVNAYVFGSVRHLDEPGDGTWTLTARDRTAGNTGTFAQWKLTLHGRP